MISIVLVAESTATVQRLEQALASHADVAWRRCHNVAEALAAAGSLRPALMIIDQQVQSRGALEIARQVLAVNAFVNLAIVSPLDGRAFHEASEGLGILAQLPPDPGAKEAERLRALLGALESVRR
jgi:two-component SAPR family response regulator